MFLFVCVCCKLFCLSLCCNNEERRNSIRHESFKAWTLSGSPTEALIFMLAYTKHCILRLSMSKCADLKTFMCSVYLQKGKKIMQQKSCLPMFRGLNRSLMATYTRTFIYYISAWHRGEFLAHEYTARDHSKLFWVLWNPVYVEGKTHFMAASI